MMDESNIIVVARNKEENKYYIVAIDDYKRCITDIITYDKLKVLAVEDKVINYKINSSTNEIEYTQGSESRLDIRNESVTRLFILEKFVKNNKTLGFKVLLAEVSEHWIDTTNIWRLTYTDTLKLMRGYDCINAKKSDSEGKIYALKGNFPEREIRDTKYKTNETVVSNLMSSVDYVAKNQDIDMRLGVNENRRLKEYKNLYSDFMLKPNGEIVAEYIQGPSMNIIKKQLESGRYKKNIKKALALGLAIAAIGGIGGNAIGAINFMPENRIEINKSIESPKTKAEAVAALSMADSITVDYGIDFTHGVVYADGVKVATLNSKLFAILNDSTLKSLDGETIASTDQKFSLFGNFKVVNENNEELTVNGHFRIFQTKLTQKDSNGNTVATIADKPETFGTKAYIKDESGNIAYEITKELFGKTFTLKKVDNSTELSNSEALMLASMLQLQAEKSSGHSSNSSKSK